MNHIQYNFKALNEIYGGKFVYLKFDHIKKNVVVPKNINVNESYFDKYLNEFIKYNEIVVLYGFNEEIFKDYNNIINDVKLNEYLNKYKSIYVLKQVKNTKYLFEILRPSSIDSYIKLLNCYDIQLKSFAIINQKYKNESSKNKIINKRFIRRHKFNINNKRSKSTI